MPLEGRVSENIATIIIINLVIVLVMALAFCSYLITKAAKTKRQLLRKVKKALEDIEGLKSELRRLRIAKKESEKNSSDLVSELSSNLDNSQQALSELSSFQEAQTEALLQLEPHLDDSEDARELKIQIASLKAQAMSSTSLVDGLKKDLVSSRYRMQSLEEKLAKRRDDSDKLKALQDLEQRAQQENKDLCQKVESQAKKLAAYLKMEREVSQLRQSNRNMEFERKDQERQLEQQAQLIEQQKASQADDTAPEAAPVSAPEPAPSAAAVAEIEQALKQVELQLDESQDELARAVREKEFIEQQFLDMLSSVESATDLEGELERAKKEYALLEENFLALAAEKSTSEHEESKPEESEPSDEERFATLDNSDISIPGDKP